MNRARVAAWCSLAVVWLLALRPCHAGGAGAVVEGVVILPEPPPVPVSKLRYPISTAYRVGDPDPPAAVVYAEGPLRGAGTAPETAEMAQHEYQFAPGLLAIRAGTRVRFPNLDDEYHSVFSYSKTRRFDLGRYHRDETPAEILFDRPGVVRLFCEIHDHMRGTILVLETPYFTRTDATGRYRLEGLPPGKWRLRVWLEDESEHERSIELGPGELLRVDFSPATEEGR